MRAMANRVVQKIGRQPARTAPPSRLANKGTSMATAIILLKVDHAKVTGTAETVLDMPDVSEVYSVSGRFDLMVIIKCDSVEKIETVITDHLLKIEGIIDSETMFAFRSLDKREGGRSIEVD